MGATSLYRPSGMTDAEFFTREFPNMLGTHGRIVAWATRRDCQPYEEWTHTFYAAVENTPDAPYAPGETWALIVCMHKGSHGRFTYKELSETMGVFGAYAPDKVLDRLTPTDNETANQWRQQCREHNAKENEKPKRITKGSTILFAHSVTFADDVAEDVFTLVERDDLRRATDGRLVRYPQWRRQDFVVID